VQYVEPLSDARTMLADFFSILPAPLTFSLGGVETDRRSQRRCHAR